MDSHPKSVDPIDEILDMYRRLCASVAADPNSNPIRLTVPESLAPLPLHTGLEAITADTRAVAEAAAGVRDRVAEAYQSAFRITIGDILAYGRSRSNLELTGKLRDTGEVVAQALVRPLALTRALTRCALLPSLFAVLDAFQTNPATGPPG